MTDLILKAKHWQIFLLIFGIPFVFQIYSIYTLFNSISGFNIISGSHLQRFELYHDFFNIFFILLIFIIVIFFTWFWSMGIGLQKYIPDVIKLNLNLFKIFMIIPVIYLFFFIYQFINIFNSIGNDPDSILFLDSFLYIIPFHLFSIFCIFYCMYFIAKTVKTAELKREVRFDDLIGEFFMLWFYPIGIWFLQPKINKIVENDLSEEIML